MTTVASVDYPNKLIYLHADTVGAELDTLDVYREVRALRRLNENHRSYVVMIVAGGNQEKIAGLTYTAAFVQLLYGCRIVPYNADQKLKLIRDTFTDDGFAGRDCFDRSSLTANVDIDVDFPEIEIREVTTEGGTMDVTEIVNGVWSKILEGSYTAEGIMKILGAVLAGRVSGAGSGAETFIGLDNSTNRVNSEVDVNGNRTTVTLDVS